MNTQQDCCDVQLGCTGFKSGRAHSYALDTITEQEKDKLLKKPRPNFKPKSEEWAISDFGKPSDGLVQPDKILIDIKTCGLTCTEFFAKAAEYQKEYPYCEIFLDGDTYSLVARPRVSA